MFFPLLNLTFSTTCIFATGFLSLDFAFEAGFFLKSTFGAGLNSTLGFAVVEVGHGHVPAKRPNTFDYVTADKVPDKLVSGGADAHHFFSLH